MFVGDASKVLRNLVVNIYFKDYEGRLVFQHAVKREGALYTADSFYHSMRFVIISSIRRNHFNNSAPYSKSQCEFS